MVNQLIIQWFGNFISTSTNWEHLK